MSIQRRLALAADGAWANIEIVRPFRHLDRNSGRVVSVKPVTGGFCYVVFELARRSWIPACANLFLIRKMFLRIISMPSGVVPLN